MSMLFRREIPVATGVATRRRYGDVVCDDNVVADGGGSGLGVEAAGPTMGDL